MQSETRMCDCVGQNEKLSRVNYMPPSHCVDETEACVLIMLGWDLFLPHFLNIVYFICAYLDTMSAALSSAMPK